MPKHHTRKRHLRKSERHHDKPEEALTIPELRRAFEHIEEFAMTHMNDVKALQEEWKKVFYKELDKESAEEYIAHVKSLPKKTKALRKTRSTKVGGSSPLGGAPLDYTTRPGIYISAGINEGSYAQVPKYVASGFWNPEMGISYDPVKGQPAWPVPYASTGSNLVKGGGCDSCAAPSTILTTGGKRKTKRSLRKGGTAPNKFGAIEPTIVGGTAPNKFGAIEPTIVGGDMMSYLQNLGTRTFGSSVPLNSVQSLERVFNGQSGGPSPSAVDNKNIKI